MQCANRLLKRLLSILHRLLILTKLLRHLVGNLSDMGRGCFCLLRGICQHRIGLLINLLGALLRLTLSTLGTAVGFQLLFSAIGRRRLAALGRLQLRNPGKSLLQLRLQLRIRRTGQSFLKLILTLLSFLQVFQREISKIYSIFSSISIKETTQSKSEQNT